MKQLLLSAVIALTGVAASAGEFGITHGAQSGREYITFDGGVEAGDADKLRMFAEMNPNATWIALSSPGGLAYEGYALSQAISDLGLNTYVGYGSACVSACYTAFIGGSEYDIDGVIAAHNSWVMGGADITINEALSSGQASGAYDTYIHAANGFNLTLPLAITHLTDKDTFVTFTHEDELLEFFARSEEDNVQDYLQTFDLTEEWIADHVTEGSDLRAKALLNLDNDRPDALDPRN